MSDFDRMNINKYHNFMNLLEIVFSNEQGFLISHERSVTHRTLFLGLFHLDASNKNCK